MSSPIREGVLDLLWSAWAELGVPGIERKHRRLASDPDPLIVFTPALASHDPRLLEQAAIWCGRHGQAVAKTRLDGLQRLSPPQVGSEYGAFVERLGGAAADWGKAKRRSVEAPTTRTSPPPLDRPALARLRMRALAGTGARADVLCELLASPNAWTSATDLERLGYTRRSISRVLADLAASRITTARSGKGAASFRLRDPQALAGLIEAQGLSWPDWSALLTLAWHLAQLERSAQQSPALAPLKARDVWDELNRLSSASGMTPEPPLLAGDSSSWTSLLTWGATALRRWPATPADAHRSSGRGF